MRIAVCDDQEFFVDEIESKIKAYLNSKHYKFKIDTFTSGLDLLGSHRYINKYDIIFLDVEMPGLNGEDIADELKSERYKPLVIFTTSHSDFAKRGYLYNAFRFLDKSDINSELDCILDDSIKKLSTEVIDATVKVNGVIVSLNDIIYVEGKNGNVNIYLNNNEVMVMKSSLKAFEKSEKLIDFVNARNNMRVNYDHIKTICNDTLKLRNGLDIKLPRTKKELVREEIVEIGARRHDALS